MRCPTLLELPPPPPGKFGWPWTVESPQLPEYMPCGRCWPRISIVTPSFNQGQYIEETIRSILLQGYPNLEYIIMDGGSTDNSIRIIKKYQPFLTYWETQPDKGQPDALNKALRIATGEWFHNINSDDVMEPASLSRLAVLTDNCDVVATDVLVSDASGKTWISPNKNLSFENLISEICVDRHWHQPGVWMKTTDLQRNKGFPVGFFLWDYISLVMRLEDSPKIMYSQETFVRFRVHSMTQTSNVKIRSQGHFVIARDYLATSLKLDSNRKRAAAEARRTEIRNLLLNDQGLHYYQLSRLRLATKIVIRNPALFFDRVYLAALKGICINYLF